MAALAVIFGGCGGKAADRFDAGENASATIGADGGAVTAQNGATVAIPAGALARDVVITIEASSTRPPGAVSASFLLGPESVTFAQPVTVVVPILPAMLPAGASTANVQVVTAPAGTTRFTALPTQIVDATHVRAMTTHFSIFAAVVDSMSNTDGGAGGGGAGGGGAGGGAGGGGGGAAGVCTVGQACAGTNQVCVNNGPGPTCVNCGGYDQPCCAMNTCPRATATQPQFCNGASGCSDCGNGTGYGGAYTQRCCKPSDPTGTGKGGTCSIGLCDFNGDCQQSCGLTDNGCCADGSCQSSTVSCKPPNLGTYPYLCK